MKQAFIKIEDLLHLNQRLLDLNKEISEGKNQYEHYKNIGISFGRSEVIQDLLNLIQEKQLFIDIGEDDGRNTTNN